MNSLPYHVPANASSGYSDSRAKPQSTYDEIAEGMGSALANMEIMHNQVLVGIYMKPNVTKGGVILTEKTVEEDKYQGKVGFVLAKGPMAFVNDTHNDFHGADVSPGDTVLYRTSDGLPLDINGYHCRLMEDVHIKAKVSDPGAIY